MAVSHDNGDLCGEVKRKANDALTVLIFPLSNYLFPKVTLIIVKDYFEENTYYSFKYIFIWIKCEQDKINYIEITFIVTEKINIVLLFYRIITVIV